MRRPLPPAIAPLGSATVTSASRATALMVAGLMVAGLMVAGLMVAALVVAASVVTGGMLGSGGAMAQASPPPGPGARPALAATITVTWAGYSVQVPRAYWLRSAKSCEQDKGSFVVVGSFQALSGCMGLGPLSGTTVLLGQGGPPFSPIPVLFATDEMVHGVSVQELDGTDATAGTNFDTSFVVALLPGRATWLYLAAPGHLPASALAGARRILATLRRAPGGRPPTSVPPAGGFIGTWEVHDAELAITSLKHGVISAQGDCQCTEADTLSLAQNGTELDATVTQVRAVGAGGKAVPDPHPNEVVGQKSFFEFMAPHLMLQATVPNEPGDLSVSFGNPYWCGKGLASQFGPACGA